MLLRACFVLFGFLVLVLAGARASAQTSTFTYQGRLTDGGAAANGTYDLEFRLFDALADGNQLPLPNPITITFSGPQGVSVANGVFTVQLDFGGATAFNGGARWLQIAVKKPTDASFVPLTPRQSLNSTPYAIKSLNAASADTATNSTQLGGVAASQYVITTDSRLTDARDPLPNSSNYIQNTTSPQSSSNFNVSGSGTVGGTLNANLVHAATQYNLLSPSLGTSVRVLAVSGLAETNTFLGRDAGALNPTGNFNSFFGNGAGRNTQGGGNNSFFGSGSGDANQDGLDNSFFGRNAGFASTGDNNTFFGSFAGSSNTDGTGNTLVGRGANVSSSNPSNATAIGALAMVTQSNSLVLGSIAGVNGATASTNVGIGTTAPVSAYRLHVEGNAFVNGLLVAGDIHSNTIQSFGAISATGPISANGSLSVDQGAISLFTVSAFGSVFHVPSLFNGSVEINDLFRLDRLGLAGSEALCRNASNQISGCSSSLRYKTNITPFGSGLNLIQRLSPISFEWKQGGMKDFGLGAEDVEKIEPLLVTHNDKGEVEGVKYDRVGVVLINAVKDQQAQIEDQRTLIQSQQKMLETQQRQIDALKKLVCSRRTSAKVCKE